MNAAPAALALVFLASACNNAAPRASEEPRLSAEPAAVGEASQGPTRPAAATAAAPAGDAATRAGSSRVSESSFELTISGSSGYETGKPGEATITLDAKAPFHINEKYPYKFKLKDSPGLKLASATVGKDAAKLEKQRMTMTVGFVPEAPGKHRLSGVLAFSVCTDDKCLIEKRDLSLEVASK